MIQAAPGRTFTAVLEAATSGLVGTLGVRIERADGTTHTARTTAGIVEIEAGSGVYAKADLVAPDDRGTYLVLWDDASDTYAVEELRVMYGQPALGEAEDFIGVGDLAAYLNPRAPRDLSSDLLAELAVAAACARIRSETGQDLDHVLDDTVTFEGTGSRELLLPQLPVEVVDEVRIDDEVDLDWALASGGILRRVANGVAGEWPAGSMVEVDYTHGYVTVPAEIRLLALTLAARAYQQGLARQESTGSSSVTWSVAGSLDLSAGERSILAKYRHPKAPLVAGVPVSS